MNARLRNIDLKEALSAEEWVGALTWSRAFYQGANEGFEDRIVFTIVQARWWAPQRLHHHKRAAAIGLQLLPMGC
jgi:hypothetical protein